MNDGVNVHAELAINKKPIYFTIKICVFFYRGEEYWEAENVENESQGIVSNDASFNNQLYIS